MSPLIPGSAQTTTASGWPGADQAIGQRFEINLDQLPKPFEGPIVRNPPLTVDRENRTPVVPADFEISLFAEKLDNPRQALVLPNGDLAVVRWSRDIANEIRQLGRRWPRQATP